jgi:AraC family transcriptional regulator
VSVRGDAAAERLLWRGAGLALGEFVCPTGDRRWEELNDIGSVSHVVFPQTSVAIVQTGRPQTVVNPNHVVFYNADQRFRRFVRDGRGDHSYFVTLDAPTMDEVAGGSFAAVECLRGPSLHLRIRLLVHRLHSGPADPSAVEEAVHELLGEALAATRPAGPPRGARPTTRTAHRRLAEDAKTILAARALDRVSLAELARELHASRFHLVRVFRRETGTTIAAYRTQLRVRAALERLLAGGDDVATIAVECGFASHSHLTDTFRRTLGTPPAGLRAAVRTEARSPGSG